MLTGRVLVLTSCHINPSVFVKVCRLKSRHLLSCREIISFSSVQPLSTWTHAQGHSSRHYHERHDSLFNSQRSNYGSKKPRPWTLSPTSWSVAYRHAGSVSPPPESEGPEPGWLKQRWIKFKTIIKAFVAGSKHLYRDVKKMRQILSTHKGKEMVLGQPPREGKLDFPLTREELFFITKTKKDLWRMLPTVTLFWIPFLGYFVPLVAFMFPHVFLTPHFLTEEQRAGLTASKHQKTLAKTKAFSNSLGKLEDREELAFLYKYSDMFTSGQVSDKVILTSSKGSPSLKTVSKDDMTGLLSVWGMKSWIPFAAAIGQRRKLTNQMRYLYTSDWLMKTEGGVECLSREALVEMCCERRLDVDFDSNEDMRNKLNVWMRLTTSFEAECPEFILAHLPAAQFIKTKD